MADPDGGSGGSLPDLASTAATLIAFADRSSALQVTVVVDQGADLSPVTVSFDPASRALELSEGDEVRVIPDVTVFGGTKPLADQHLHDFPPFEIDLEEGSITGVIGGLDHLGRSVAELARLFGGASVATASFRTADGPPLEIGASAMGEMAVSCGEVDFEVPEEWPGG